MRRVLVALGLLVVLGAVFGAAPAAAGPDNLLTATLSCDRGVTATVTVTIVANATDEPVWTCDADSRTVRAVLATPVPETAIVVTRFDVSTDPVGCADPAEVPLPARIDCGPKSGAKLVVR
jgi:hypothetical protein